MEENGELLIRANQGHTITVICHDIINKVIIFLLRCLIKFSTSFSMFNVSLLVNVRKMLTGYILFRGVLIILFSCKADLGFLCALGRQLNLRVY